MKRIISIALLLAMAFSMVVSAKEIKVVGFSDLEAEWSKWYINKCLETGAMTGTTAPDENGIAKFSPKMNVSLGQFLAAITKLLCPELVKPQEAGQSWTFPYYNAAIEANIIGKNDFDYADIDKNLSREDMAYIVVGAIKYNGETLEIMDGIEKYIRDYSSISDNRKEAVKQVYSTGIINGTDELGTFSPKGTMTRESMAKVICCVLYPIDRYTTITPTVCPYTFLTHIYETKEVVAPTIHEQGYTVYVCKDCGYSYNDNFTAKIPYYDFSKKFVNDGGVAVTSMESVGAVAGKMIGGIYEQYRKTPNPNASKNTANVDLNNVAFYGYGGLRFFDDGIAKNYEDRGVVMRLIKGADERTGVNVFGWRKNYESSSGVNSLLNLTMEAFYYLTNDRYVAKALWEVVDYMFIFGPEATTAEVIEYFGFRVENETSTSVDLYMNNIHVRWEWGNGINGNNFFFYPAK